LGESKIGKCEDKKKQQGNAVSLRHLLGNCVKLCENGQDSGIGELVVGTQGRSKLPMDEGVDFKI